MYLLLNRTIKRLFLGIFCIFFTSSSTIANDDKSILFGTYNTGLSELDDPDPSSLNVRFESCKNDSSQSTVCGYIIEIVDPRVDQITVMPDGSPMIGFEMISGLKFKGNGKFNRGRINAVDESIRQEKMKWYGAKVQKLDDGNIKVTGCLGFICPRSLIWSEITENNDADITRE